MVAPRAVHGSDLVKLGWGAFDLETVSALERAPESLGLRAAQNQCLSASWPSMSVCNWKEAEGGKGAFEDIVVV